MTDRALHPCWWCGPEGPGVKVSHVTSETVDGYAVECANGCSGPAGASEIAAIAAWNNCSTAESQEAVDVLHKTANLWMDRCIQARAEVDRLRNETISATADAVRREWAAEREELLKKARTAMTEGTWKCSACGTSFAGNAVTPERTEIGKFALYTFCARCAPGVVRAGDVIEQVPLEELVGCKPVIWPPPPASTQVCPECGEAGVTVTAHKNEPHLVLYSCAAMHEWELDLRGESA